MTARIGLRRIEMIGNRIEACCAAYKINAQVTPVNLGRGRLTFLVSTTPVYDLRRLADELSLSLFVPVTVYRDAVVCEAIP